MSLTEIINNEQGCFEVRGPNDDIKKFLILLDEQETRGKNKDKIDHKTRYLDINSRESKSYNPVIFARQYTAYVKRGSALVKLCVKNTELHLDNMINMCYNILKDYKNTNKTTKYMN
jgi:hypothetical protein